MEPTFWQIVKFYLIGITLSIILTVEDGIIWIKRKLTLAEAKNGI